MKPKLSGLTVLPSNTILVIGIRRPAGDAARMDTRGRAQSLITRYVAHKAGGLWYVAGEGKVPQGGVAWRGLASWLSGREIEYIDMSEAATRIWPSETDQGAKHEESER